jgi:hypothetical protein
VSQLTHYAECHYAECRYAECHYAECHYAECRKTECHHAECRYAECKAECHYAECRYAECPSAIKTLMPIVYDVSIPEISTEILIGTDEMSLQAWLHIPHALLKNGLMARLSQ